LKRDNAPAIRNVETGGFAMPDLGLTHVALTARDLDASIAVKLHKGVLPVALLVVCLATSATAQENSALEKTVKQCVDVVHRFPSDEIEKRFFQKFDAFYNPATGTVQSNAVYVGGQAALYQFNKYMASKGFPLGSSSNQR
jgi:hypothetical protein